MLGRLDEMTSALTNWLKKYEEEKTDSKSDDKPKKKTWKDIDNKGNISNHNVDAIYGYIRLSYKADERIFPIDIIKLIIFFYQDGITWKFTKEELMLFDTVTQQEDKILSESFDINGITFNYVVYPKYAALNYLYSEVRFGLEASKVPDDIEYMIIYFELCCVELNNTFKSTNTFGQHVDSGSVHKFFKTKDIEKRIVYDMDNITFTGCMDILCIKYKYKDCKLNKDPRFMYLTKINKFCKFKWEIEKEIILTKLHEYDIKQCDTSLDNDITEFRIYSKTNFNHNIFGLCLSNCQNINGLDIKTPNTLIIKLRMFRIPARIKKLDVTIKCEIFNGVNNDKNKNYKRMKIIKNGSEQSFNLYKFDRYSIKKLMKDLQNNALIKIEIQVNDIFDYNDNKIQENKWMEYGIL